MDPFAGGVCALVSAAIWAFSATYMTAPARLYGGRAANLFKSAVGATFFLLTVLVWLGPEALKLSLPVYGLFIASGILGLAIADTAYLTSLKHIGPTLTAIVYQTSGIFTVILGMVFLNETLTFVEIGGIALIIGGVLLAVLADPVTAVAAEGSVMIPVTANMPLSAERGHRTRGAIYALVAAAFHSMGVVLNKAGFDEFVAYNGTSGPRAAMIAGFTRMSAAAVSLFALGIVSGSLARQTRVFREAAGWRSTFLPAFFGTFIAMITMQISLTSLKSGVASVLLSMTPIFTIPVEWWVLKHRPTVRGIVGALIAVLGVACLLLRES